MIRLAEANTRLQAEKTWKMLPAVVPYGRFISNAGQCEETHHLDCFCTGEVVFLLTEKSSQFYDSQNADLSYSRTLLCQKKKNINPSLKVTTSGAFTCPTPTIALFTKMKI